MPGESNKVDELAQAFRDSIKPKLEINTPRSINKILVVIDEAKENQIPVQLASKLALHFHAESSVVLLYEPKAALTNLKESHEEFERSLQEILSKRDEYYKIEGVKLLVDPRVNQFFENYEKLKHKFSPEETQNKDEVNTNPKEDNMGSDSKDKSDENEPSSKKEEKQPETKDVSEEEPSSLLEEQLQDELEESQKEPFNESEEQQEKSEEEEEIVFERKEGFIETVYQEEQQKGEEEEETVKDIEEKLEERLEEQKTIEERQKEVFDKTIELIDNLSKPLEKGQTSLKNQLLNYIEAFQPSLLIMAPNLLSTNEEKENQDSLSNFVKELIPVIPYDILIMLTSSPMEIPPSEIVGIIHATQREDSIEAVGVATLTFLGEESHLTLLGVVDQATVNSVKLVSDNLSSDEIQRQLLERLKIKLQSLRLKKDDHEYSPTIITNFGSVDGVVSAFLGNFSNDLVVFKDNTNVNDTLELFTVDVLTAVTTNNLNVLITR